MLDLSFKGPFAECIADHVSLKRAIGYRFEADAESLMRFSIFTAEKYPDVAALTREIVLDWCAKKLYEAQANQSARASTLRQLAIYMDNIGLNAYILPKGYYPAGEQYIPHIFTENELQRFFSARSMPLCQRMPLQAFGYAGVLQDDLFLWTPAAGGKVAKNGRR